MMYIYCNKNKISCTSFPSERIDQIGPKLSNELKLNFLRKFYSPIQYMQAWNIKHEIEIWNWNIKCKKIEKLLKVFNEDS